MSQMRARAVSVTDSDGVRGTFDPASNDSEAGRVLVRLEDGRQVLVPAGELRREGDGTYTLPFSLSDLTREASARAPHATTPREDGGSVVVPVVAEQLDVQKRKVEAGGVRIRKTVSEREEIVDEPLMREEVQVKRVPVGRVVEGPVPVRHVGDTMIVSLLEEVLVVEKKLMLKEELHITKEKVETYKPQRVKLRTEQVVVERVDDPSRGRDDARAEDDETKIS